jgi:hypothetical protein
MGKAASYKDRREQSERDALRLLCSERISPDTRVHLTGLLEKCEFVNELNGAVYEEIAAIGPVSTRRLRELLPGRVTLRGFPDFELKEFLGNSVAEDDIDKLFDRLLDLTEEPLPNENRKALGQSA